VYGIGGKMTKKYSRKKARQDFAKIIHEVRKQVPLSKEELKRRREESKSREQDFNSEMSPILICFPILSVVPQIIKLAGLESLKDGPGKILASMVRDMVELIIDSPAGKYLVTPKIKEFFAGNNPVCDICEKDIPRCDYISMAGPQLCRQCILGK
jgi:hypothetical protein